jgi:CubicO group peptidase (beta-lactamase class C family)
MPIEDFLQQRLFKPLGMRNTTFWPTKKELRRLATTYQADATGSRILPVQIPSLTYPLDDHKHRFPHPAGGLFSTADDVAHFCELLLNNGVFEGKRYLSVESVKLMTTKETGKLVSQQYGFGWNIAGDSYEHGGADSTDMRIDEKSGLITIFLVQRTGTWDKEDRKKLMTSVEQAANALGSSTSTEGSHRKGFAIF